jgi:hypothetical protein
MSVGLLEILLLFIVFLILGPRRIADLLRSGVTRRTSCPKKSRTPSKSPAIKVSGYRPRRINSLPVTET